MTKQQAIEKFCQLSSEVGSQVFKDSLPYDCFCGANKLSDNLANYHFSEEIFKFIEQATIQAMENGQSPMVLKNETGME